MPFLAVLDLMKADLRAALCGTAATFTGVTYHFAGFTPYGAISRDDLFFHLVYYKVGVNVYNDCYRDYCHAADFNVTCFEVADWVA